MVYVIMLYLQCGLERKIRSVFLSSKMDGLFDQTAVQVYCLCCTSEIDKDLH